MRRIVTLGLIGWAGIVGLAWYLANERLHHCYNWQVDDSPCIMKALAARDSTLINGLSIGLVLATILALIFRPSSPLRERMNDAWFKEVKAHTISLLPKRNSYERSAGSIPKRTAMWILWAGGSFMIGLVILAVWASSQPSNTQPEVEWTDAPLGEVPSDEQSHGPIAGLGPDAAIEAGDDATASWQDAPLAEEADASVAQ